MNTLNSEYPKVTIVGAGNVGANAALLLVMKNLANVVLIDVADGLAEGKALDIMHMRSIEQFAPVIIGTCDYAKTAGSDIVVITAGVPRKPGMTREDLLSVNAKIVRSVLEMALPLSPDAIYMFVSNPLDVMTNLAFSLAGLPKQRLFGMGGVLDSARFVHSIAKATGAEPADIEAMVIGAHGASMMPLPRMAKVNGTAVTQLLSVEQIEEVVASTVQGGAAIVELLKIGSAFYAPAASIAKMVEEILRPSGEVLSVCARLEGEYGIDGVHMCVPSVLGKGGLERIVEFELTDEELAQLVNAANSIKVQLTSL